jgi:hypothetical protein
MRLRSLVVLALAPPLTMLAPARATAQSVIRSRVAGSDVVIDCVSGPCSGDLLRGAQPDLPSGLPLYLAGVTLPVTLPDEAAILGVEDGRYYQLADPSGVAISNLAFRQERHLDPQFLPDGTPVDSTFLVSLPTLRSIADLADTSAPQADKCVGDADGPAAGDGARNADDLLCAWWSSRGAGSGSMLVSRLDPSGGWQVRSAFHEPLTGRIEFSGTWTDPIDDGADGYLVTVDGPPGAQNRFVITGADDPAWAGTPIVALGGAQTNYLLSFPYDGVADAAEGVLCDPLAILDTDGNGFPDACPGGIFDGAHPVAVAWRDSVPDGAPVPGADGTWIARAVTHAVFGTIFAGRSFPLRPGEGLLVAAAYNQVPTLYLPPRY